MPRKDVTVSDGKMTIHPAKIGEMKKRIREDLKSRPLTALRDEVIDQELKYCIEEVVLDEIAAEMRPEIRRMILEAIENQ